MSNKLSDTIVKKDGTPAKQPGPEPTYTHEELIEFIKTAEKDYMDNKRSCSIWKSLRATGCTLCASMWTNLHQNNPDISYWFRRLLDLQEEKLVDYGLFRKVDTTMAIFQLKNNHGHIESDKKQSLDIQRQRLEQDLDKKKQSDEPMNITFKVVEHRSEEDIKALQDQDSKTVNDK